MAISCTREATVEGDHAVDAKHREQHCGKGKAGDQDSIEPARRFALRDGLHHGLHLRQGQLRIDRRHGSAKSVFHLLRRHRRAQYDIASIATQIVGLSERASRSYPPGPRE